MSEHTPLPWRVFPELSRDNIEIGLSGNEMVLMVHNSETPDFGDEAEPREREWANAEFIVRAVNSHESLLDAVRQAEEALDAVCDCNYPSTENYCAQCLAKSILRDVITKVEGGPNE